MSKVFIAKCPNYSMNLLEKIMDDIFLALDIDSLLFEGANILIKPNLLMKRKPLEATTTHPDVLRALIIALKKRGSFKITIADSPGGPYTKNALKAIYDETGMSAVVANEGVALNFDVSSTLVTAKDAIRCTKFSIINPVLQADIIFDMCKLKTHSMTVLSGAVKNLFGCVPGLTKPEFHFRFPDSDHFADMLVDLCELVHPHVSICDAIISMEGDGPSAGNPYHLGAVFASKSPYALDIAACTAIGIDPMQVPMLRRAAERNLAPTSIDQIEITGASLQSVTVTDYKTPRSHGTDFLTRIPKFLRKPASAMINPRPSINSKTCIGCGKCKESCPASVISMEKHKAKIDYSGCIKCYCCHEMCPVKAISIKRLRLFDL